MLHQSEFLVLTINKARLKNKSTSKDNMFRYPECNKVKPINKGQSDVNFTSVFTPKEANENFSMHVP
jgi:hypothetical protein